LGHFTICATLESRQSTNIFKIMVFTVTGAFILVILDGLIKINKHIWQILEKVGRLLSHTFGHTEFDLRRPS